MCSKFRIERRGVGRNSVFGPWESFAVLSTCTYNIRICRNLLIGWFIRASRLAGNLELIVPPNQQTCLLLEDRHREISRVPML